MNTQTCQMQNWPSISKNFKKNLSPPWEAFWILKLDAFRNFDSLTELFLIGGSLSGKNVTLVNDHQNEIDDCG